MKRAYRILCAGLACMCLMGFQRAKAEEPSAVPVDPQRAAEGPVLEIANGCLLPGMDRPYESGYMPAVEGDEVQIVLPLSAADALDAPESISVRVDLGDTSAPFVFENYDLRVPRSEIPDTTDSLYCIDLVLALESPREGGRYPVSFTCTGRTQAQAFSQTFTVFVTVPGSAAAAPDPAEQPLDPNPAPEGGDLLSPDPDDISGGDVLSGYDTAGDGSSGSYGAYEETGSAAASTPTPEPTPAPQPKLMVTAVSVNPSPVTAGSAFSVSVTLKNTSTSVPASNMLLTAEGDGADVFVPDGHGSAYPGTIKAGETYTLTADMMCAPEAEPGPKKITIHAGYDGPQGTGYTQDESITAEITQPVRFSVDEPDFPSSLTAGDTWSLPLNVMNLGRAAIRNVSCSVEAPGIRAQSTLFLGNLDGGTAKQGTLYAFVGAKSDAEGEARYGRTNGLVTVTCEDEFGAVHTEELPFSLAIDAPQIRSTHTEEPEQEVEETAFPWQMSVLICAGIAAGAAALWLVHRARERKRDANL